MQLKAAPTKITSIELLSSTTARHQLLAVGDDTGTLHIHEMPRNLTKPVHKEESTMLKFLERELQRIELEKAAKEEAANRAKAEGHHHEEKGMVNTTSKATAADAFAKDNKSAAAGAPSDISTMTQAEAAAKAEQAALQKEEEEFLKLESAFIVEMGIDTSQLPSFVK